ncbi:hypothetical protein EGI22_01900 [Lacihabitans sp. LS3-19]|uniref:FtsL-like putative cell division protein n=1 Tax=Lacihabitans sp. LS3-19 TaxID=2487335 RepID=UPI0020CDE4DB|nr:FtsL-like putative cell division protein [Lacihabitans sp. LS3-19]MCP9766643.1 hypothetical protein [Lacihabitans sp. LS3-19]
MSQNRSRKRVEPKRSRSFNFNLIEPLSKWVNQKLELDERLSPGTLRKVLWIGLMVTIYIFFQHNFDSLIRKLDRADRQVNEQRASFISHKSRYLYASKQSEIEKKLQDRGFEKNAQAPIKIAIKNL